MYCKVIDVSHNELENIDGMMLNTQQKIDRLDLSHNQILKIDKFEFSFLLTNELILHNNLLQDVAAGYARPYQEPGGNPHQIIQVSRRTLLK